MTDAAGDAGGVTASDAPTRQLVSGAVGDRCGNCEAPLAGDQSYCLNCGERRGKARFSFASMTAPQPAASPPRRREPRRPRFSSSATLIAGIGTLLLAMGVGVLIGEQGTTKATPAASTQPIIIHDQGGGGATAASTPSATTTPSVPTHSSAKATRHQTKIFAPKTVVITKKVQAKAAAAAQSVLGGGAHLTNPTVSTGGTCSNSQPGCQNGHFTGTFFSP